MSVDGATGTALGTGVGIFAEAALVAGAGTPARDVLVVRTGSVAPGMTAPVVAGAIGDKASTVFVGEEGAGSARRPQPAVAMHSNPRQTSPKTCAQTRRAGPDSLTRAAPGAEDLDWPEGDFIG